MSRVEWLDRTESKYHPSYEELLEESNARHIQKALKGQLSPTTEEWIRTRRKEE